MLSLICFIASLLIFALFLVEAWLFLSARRHRKFISDFEYDTSRKNVSTYVLIPCLNEEKVIESTLNSLLATSSENIKFIVIDDASSDTTSQIINKFSDDRLSVLTRILPDAQNGKGAALNFALNTVVIPEVNKKGLNHDEVIIAVMDADSYVEIDYFDHAHTLFASNPEIKAIQSKVKIVPNTNRLFDLTHMQDLEFSVILNAMQGIRAKNANAALGGNGQFTRLSALDILLDDGPWTNSLVEDFDLSTRFTLQNVRSIVHIVDLVVFQSGVSNIRKLIRQRARWAQGNMQSNKFIPNIIRSRHISFKGKVELLYFLTKPWLVIFEFLIIGIVVFQFIFYGFPDSTILPIWLNILMVFSLFFVNFFWSIYYLIDKENQMLQKSKIANIFITLTNGIFLSFFMIILNFAYLRALIRLIARKNSWDKTDRKQ